MVRILRAIAWVARRSPRNKQHKVFVPRRRNIFYPPWIGSEVHDASPSFATRRSQSPTPSLNATQPSHKPKSYPPQPSPRSVSNPKRYDLTNYYSSSLQQQLHSYFPTCTRTSRCSIASNECSSNFDFRECQSRLAGENGLGTMRPKHHTCLHLTPLQSWISFHLGSPPQNQNGKVASAIIF